MVPDLAPDLLTPLSTDRPMEELLNLTKGESYIKRKDENLNFISGIIIEQVSPENEKEAVELIRKNFYNFEEAGSVLASTFIRMEKLLTSYSQSGARLFLAKIKATGTLVGCIGLGPLAGLPYEERIGEVREFVIDQSSRGLGLGSHLLELCLTEAKRLDYKRIYLSTTPQMQHAQKLFVRFGFKPVIQQTKSPMPPSDVLPCYFVLEMASQ